MEIVPMRDLKNTVRIEELCKDSGKVFVTKNGYGRLVVMDIDYYRSIFEELEEAKAVYILLIERLALVCDFPESNPMIKNRFLGFHEVRKMVIKNYLLYYYVDENNKTINVLSIRHSLENQEKII